MSNMLFKPSNKFILFILPEKMSLKLFVKFHSSDLDDQIYPLCQLHFQRIHSEKMQRMYLPRKCIPMHGQMVERQYIDSLMQFLCIVANSPSSLLTSRGAETWLSLSRSVGGASESWLSLSVSVGGTSESWLSLSVSVGGTTEIFCGFLPKT